MARAPSNDSARLLGIVTAVICVGALYFGRAVFVPIVLALLFSLLLAPAVSGLERIKLPRIAAILVVVAVLVGLTGSAAWLTSEQFTELTDRLPAYRQTLARKIQSLQGMQSGRYSAASAAVQSLERQLAATVPAAPASDGKEEVAPGTTASFPLAVQVVPPTNPLGSVEAVFGPLANVAVIVVFTIFMLLGREDLRNRFLKLAAGGQFNLMTRALDETTHRINRYLLLQLIVNSGYGLIIGAALYFLGIPNAPLWGATAVVFRFLPYVGPPLAAAVPIILSLAAFPGWWHAAATVTVYIVLELAVANFVEPLVYGAQVGLSPLAILVAAVFWTLLWGFPGLLLSTPLTVCLVVIGRHAPGFSFLNTILGDEPVLTPPEHFYQRMLASDQTEANIVLETYKKDHTLEETYRAVVFPALGLAEQDRHRRQLDEETQLFILQGTRELMEELGTDDDPIEKPSAGLPDVLCLPARDEADAVAAFGLCQLLDGAGLYTSSAGISTIQEALSLVSGKTPKAVCISALPPFALGHARALYSRLKTHFPELSVVVCYWHFDGDLERVSKRLKLSAGDRLFTTIPQVTAHFINAEPEQPNPGGQL